jgi:hypothetical protein
MTPKPPYKDIMGNEFSVFDICKPYQKEELCGEFRYPENYNLSFHCIEFYLLLREMCYIKVKKYN